MLPSCRFIPKAMDSESLPETGSGRSRLFGGGEKLRYTTSSSPVSKSVGQSAIVLVLGMSWQVYVL